MLHPTSFVLLATVMLQACSMDGARREERGSRGGVGETARPKRVDATQRRVESLRLPPGFSLNVFAGDLGNPRMLAVADDGSVYVTRPAEGDVLVLVDTDGDGVADVEKTAISGFEGIHGIARVGSTFYLATATHVMVVTALHDGRFSSPATIIDDLPDTTRHAKRTLGIGPDGRLYISVGSSCNACIETNNELATLLRANVDGSNRTIFARGLRNTIGFAWHPTTGQLWGLDIGSDWRGNDQPPEELNLLEEGHDYGWPYVYGHQRPDPFMEDPPGTTKEAYAQQTTPPVLMYSAHASPIGMTFLTRSAFPRDYRGDVMATMRGSWNRDPPIGYKVVRIRFREGQPYAIEDFLTGFLSEDGEEQFGRVAGVTVASDGSLLIAEDSNGMIYRVTWNGSPQ